jgi:hypothetical protein
MEMAKAEAHTRAKVIRLPACDFCGKVARYDARVKGMGSTWAYMCEGCFAIRGVGLGLGKGQELILVTGGRDKC